MYPWKSLFWKAFRILWLLCSRHQSLGNCDWQVASLGCEDIGHSCGNEDGRAPLFYKVLSH